MVELTKKEIEEIELEAQLELEAEEKEEALKEAKEAAKSRLKKKAVEASKDPKKGTKMVRVNLGNHSDRVVINGRTFMHGRSYPLTLDEEKTILDIAFRTHLHQAEKKGGKWQSDFYGRQRSNITI
jgi:hypothetical protein